MLKGIASLLCLLLPLLSSGQTDRAKLDSLMRQIPGSGPTMMNSFRELEGLILKSPAEQITNATRVVHFIDSMHLSQPSTVTSTSLYIKARLQKDVLDQPYNAFQTTIDAFELAEKKQEYGLQFLSLAQAGHISHYIGNTKEAVRYGNQAIRFFDEMDTTLRSQGDWGIGILSIYEKVALAYYDLDQYDSALQKINAALELSLKFNNRDWFSILSATQALVYGKTGRTDEALKLRIEAYNQLRRQRTYWEGPSHHAMSIAALYIQKNDLINAQRYLDSVKLFLEKMPFHEEDILSEYWQIVSALEKQKGNYLAALTAHEKFSDMREVLKKKQQATMVTNVMASYEFDKSQRAIHDLEIENSAQRNRFIAIVIVLSLSIVLVVYFIYNYRRQRRTSQHIALQRDEIELKNVKLDKALIDLKSLQEQLVHSEKMSSVGQLTAGLMHEINNPINFVQTGTEALQENLKVLLEFVAEFENINESNFEHQLKKIQGMKTNLGFDSLVPEIQALVRTIRSGSERTASIVANLHRFSRKSEGGFSEILISKPIEDTLLLIASELRGRISVTTHFEAGLIIGGRVTDLEQVFMNILMNASQAIKDKGNITITTRREGDHAEISIRDDGPGIPDEIRGKIFDPFFTTKPVGKGMGLGLSVTHELIKGHSGHIDVRNHPDGGAEFIIHIPFKK